MWWEPTFHSKSSSPHFGAPAQHRLVLPCLQLDPMQVEGVRGPSCTPALWGWVVDVAADVLHRVSFCLRAEGSVAVSR